MNYDIRIRKNKRIVSRWIMSCFLIFCFILMVLSFIKIEANKPLIVIDPGHGGKDPGTMSGQWNEKDINLEVATMLKKKCKKLGYKVMLTRKDDTFIELEQRADIANTEDAALFVSIHCNSCETESVQGLECYYYPQSEISSSVAKAMEDTLTKSTNFKVNKSREGDFSVLRNTAMPAVLVELGYMSNAEECARLVDEEYQRLLSDDLANAIDQAYESLLEKAN